jgi:hypothetical protein
MSRILLNLAQEIEPRESWKARDRDVDASPVRISGSSVTGNGQYRKPTRALFLFGLLLFFFWFVASTHASSIPRFLEKVSFSII